MPPRLFARPAAGRHTGPAVPFPETSTDLDLEDQLWDPPGAREAMRKAIAIAKDGGRAVALSLHETDDLDTAFNEVMSLAKVAAWGPE